MTSKRLAPSRSMKRPYNRRFRKSRFLLLCEGEVTETDYFKDLARLLRSSLIEVEVAREIRKDPKRLVELANDRRALAKREARRANDSSLAYDEVWCVFDVDNHARLKEAINQASSLSIDLAISNPCFEIWILIHFQDQWAHITGDKVCEYVKRHIPNYEKHLDLPKVKGKACGAIKRAKQMEDRAASNGNHWANPSSGVWRLVSNLCQEARVPTENL